MCLISNALKYTPEGIVTVSVTLAPSKDNPEKEIILFEVEDQGVGIAEEKQKSLFAPFQQAQKHAGGTGLGLYSMSQRMEALNGSYGVGNRHDGQSGARFWFAFPYRPDEITAEMERCKSNPATPHNRTPVHGVVYSPRTTALMQRDQCLAEGNGVGEDYSISAALEVMGERRNTRSSVDTIVNVATQAALSLQQQPVAIKKTGLRVLLVDDSAFILKMLNKVMVKGGYEVVQAMNGLEALKELDSSGPFHVMVIDLQMPVLDGLETIRRIRKKESEAASSSNSSNTATVGLGGAEKLGLKPLDISRSVRVSPNTLNTSSTSRQMIFVSSANGDDNTIQEAIMTGADDFIIKPFSLEIFRSMLSKHNIHV